MLTTIKKPKYFKSLAVCNGSGALKYCAKLVKIIGITIIGIASIGSITKVSKAIAAEGNPIPTKPLTTPEIKNVKTINKSVK